MGLLSEYTQVTKLLQEKHPLVFFAESRHYYQYFEKLIYDVLSNSRLHICYITADAKDPLLSNPRPRMKVIYSKWMLGFLFSRIKADVMIMTMPDMDNFLFKRSKGVGCYIYMFHAVVSTHLQYRQKAFFNYDTIFCTGDYQQKEIRTAEKIYHLTEKEIVPYGYPLFDSIQHKATHHPPATILIAPSWFEGCIFDTCIEELLLQLSGLSYTIILRTHPEYVKRRKKEFKKIQKLIAKHSNLFLDDKPSVEERLSSTSILITDRSGIAFEFAFGTGRPVLFIDTVSKQANPHWKELGIEPIENLLRNELGVSILPSQLAGLRQKLNELEALSIGFAQKMDALKKATFYNSAIAYQKGWEYVISKTRRD